MVSATLIKKYQIHCCIFGCDKLEVIILFLYMKINALDMSLILMHTC